ncbi:macro domain-containing protein [uncultured Fusobacterium sp.]|uniref:macro domain-containing protein n=1 Tax=uncultured Fusobacterium sp. TaxID=159267 RepID=UPI0025ECC232|nr:macro domain-containing protein [uncultured Fusobacterium sp.]
MKEIIYLKGDATSPQVSGHKIIAHICNNRGSWGAGFVMAISKKWSLPEIEYRKWIERKTATLGEIQLVPVEDEIVIANMIAQDGFVNFLNPIAVRYETLKECLTQLAYRIKSNDVSVHMPRIGCGIAGGKWEEIEPIIKETLCKNDIQVYVYDLK